MGLSRTCRDLFNSAKICIENEDIEQAKSLIEQAIALAPTDEETVSRAVVQLVYAELYSSARKVYEDYRKRTGLELLSYNYAQVIQWDQENMVVNDRPVFDLANGPIRFKRLSDLERGSLFSYVTTDAPVEEIKVSEQGVDIVQSGIKYREYSKLT